jgi:hypothetical protein
MAALNEERTMESEYHEYFEAFSLEEIEAEIFSDLENEKPATGWNFGNNSGFEEITIL